MILANTILALPFVVRNVSASLATLDRSLEEAVWILGASKPVAFVKVALPLAKPGIISGMFLSFIVAFNEFTVSFFLYTPAASGARVDMNASMGVTCCRCRCQRMEDPGPAAA